jgi:hypothetical protein
LQILHGRSEAEEPVMVATTDLELVRAALGGDAAAFERLAGVCEGIAARFVATRGLAPERSQEQVRRACEAILAALPGYGGETPLFVFAFGALIRGAVPQDAAFAARPGSRQPEVARAAEQR